MSGMKPVMTALIHVVPLVLLQSSYAAIKQRLEIGAHALGFALRRRADFAQPEIAMNEARAAVISRPHA